MKSISLAIAVVLALAGLEAQAREASNGTPVMGATPPSVTMGSANLVDIQILK
jgi:hypothetical protein